MSKALNYKREKDDPTWVIGTYLFGEGQIYPYQAKVYDEPSEYGINQGRVSKLMVTGREPGKYSWRPDNRVAQYDRGWDQEPTEDFRPMVNELVEILGFLPPIPAPGEPNDWGHVVPPHGPISQALTREERNEILGIDSQAPTYADQVALDPLHYQHNQPADSAQDLVDEREAARLLGLSYRTLQNKIHLGKIPADCYTVTVTGRRLYFKNKILGLA
jgi:hypothetical protein